MNAELLSIILDITVLVCLGFTIYYALKLSRSLNNFRTYREEFNGLMAELNSHIEQAYEAIRTMKDTSNRSGDDLEYLLRESQDMEKKLRKLNETSGQFVNSLEEDVGEGDNVQAFIKAEDEGFAIRDPEFSDDDEHNDESMKDFDSAEEEEELGDFQSKAEKELYQALQSNKKSGKKRA